MEARPCHDFKRALDDLLALEDMFLDTVTGIAKTSDGAFHIPSGVTAN
jgi:hypothetical protein